MKGHDESVPTGPARTEAERLEAARRYDILDTPPDGAFDRVCALAARFFGLPAASVSIVDEDRIWFKARRGIDATEVPREPGLCASAILQDGPYAVTDGLSDPRTAANSLVHGEPAVRFYAAAPITTADGYRLGTVNVLGAEPRELTDEEARTLQELAAIVMDEMELRLAAMREIRQERERRERAMTEKQRAEGLARTLQQTLSPSKLPEVPGLEIAAHYQPFAPEEVGGDFYDVFPLAARRWGFFLGDVCGKGVDAATLTSLARYTLRTAAMLREDPAAALADLNAALFLERPDDFPICTAVYGDIERRDDGFVLSLAIAGHPPPLILRAGGRVEPITRGGPLLGAIRDPAFETCRVAIAPGDAAVIYSDGMLDVHHAGGVLSEQRLADLLAGATGAAARDLIARLREVLRTADRPLRDDVAILAMRCADVA